VSEEERSRGDIRWPYCSPSASLASPVALVAQPGPCFAFLASERICHLKIPHLPLTWRPLTPSGRPLAPLPLAPLCLTGRAHCDTNGLADKGPCETEREGGREGGRELAGLSRFAQGCGRHCCCHCGGQRDTCWPSTSNQRPARSSSMRRDQDGDSARTRNQLLAAGTSRQNSSASNSGSPSPNPNPDGVLALLIQRSSRGRQTTPKTLGASHLATSSQTTSEHVAKT